jgi:hypothetical protein
MSHVYRVNSYDAVVYTNTVRESARAVAADQWDSTDRVDAAGECNRLAGELRAAEEKLNRARLVLAELVDVAPRDTLATVAGSHALAYLEANPLPPADSAHRDGGRSYGGG